jgi:teichuronic acid biosynthesis glycosyltransferase TuaG
VEVEEQERGGDTLTVSVVIPAHNSGGTIVETLDSIAAQEVPVREIVVVDDLSTDDTVAVVEQWRRDHQSPALVLVKQDKNTGPAGARNRGIEVATGEWIAFLDADDAWLPSKLSIQLALVNADPEVALVCGRMVPLEASGEGARIEDVTGGSANPEPVGRALLLEDFVSHNPVGTSTVLVRRDVLVAAGAFDLQFCGPEDYDLWLRLVSGYTCLELGVPLSRYRNTVGSLSMDERKFLPQVLRVLAKAFGEGGALYRHQEFRRRAHAEQYSSASWMAYNRGACGAALWYLLRSWCYDVRFLHKEQDDPLLRLKLLFRYVLRRKPDASAAR